MGPAWKLARRRHQYEGCVKRVWPAVYCMYTAHSGGPSNNAWKIVVGVLVAVVVVAGNFNTFPECFSLSDFSNGMDVLLLMVQWPCTSTANAKIHAPTNKRTTFQALNLPQCLTQKHLLE